MSRYAFAVLLCLGIAACSNPFSVGPGRLAISLDQAKVVFVDDATLFNDAPQAPITRVQRQALQLNISSQTDVFQYFVKWQRHLQVRCVVEGNVNGRNYRSVSRQPMQIIDPTSKDYRYRIYAFIDLKADDTEYERGRPATTLDLKAESFESLKCHLLGVTKAPVLFPRSNEVVVTSSTFRRLLLQGK
jgi:hypothetical protein